MRTSQVRKTRSRNLPTALQVEPAQVTENSQLGKALVPYSVAALHVELSKVVQARQTAQLFACKRCTAFMHGHSIAFWFTMIGQ